MAILYRHIRLDKNEPFYIGIGLNESRAYGKTGRGSYWKRIVKKAGYSIDILFSDLTWEEACIKEKEFIALYGRKDLGLGPLINMTNGGEGLCNPSKEVRDRLSKTTKERLATQEGRDYISEKTKDAMKRPEVKKIISEAQKRRFSCEENRKITREKTKLAMHRPDVRKKFLDSIEKFSNSISKLKTIYKDRKEKRVQPDKLQDYLNDGWKMGRCPYNKLGRKKRIN